MGQELLLGIDIGTSGCKIALFDTDGNVVSMGDAQYPVHYPQEGYAEQDPEDWWKAVCRVISAIITEKAIDPSRIEGVGLSGQSWSAIPVDSDGAVLAPNPIWMDSRSGEICARLNDAIGEEKIFGLCGNPLKPQYTTGKILWFKENMGTAYKNASKILQSNSFLALRLTGVCSQEATQGYGLHCFDMRNCRWDDELCAELGIDRHLLPDIYKCHDVVGKVTAEAAALTGLRQGTPVVAGGLDAACGTLGAGVLHTGQTQEQGGQAGGMSICVEEYCADPRLILSFHVVPGKWLLQGGTTGGGGAMRWFDRQFGYKEKIEEKETGRKSFQLLDELAQSVPAGSEGLIFLPYMAGERSPIWNEKAKGVFFGLDYSKTRAHMLRSVLEGVAYSLRHNIDVALKAGAEVGVMRSMGGAANSRLWTQLKADVTGNPIEVPASDTASTLGAAILAGVGIGLYSDFDEAVNKTVTVKRRFDPDAALKETYDSGYKTYIALYEALKHLMNDREAF